MPASLQLSKGKIVKCTLETHEQDGKQPVLLSKPSQAELGLLKDMRNNTCYLKDFGDYVEICRAHDTGLDCICVSNYTVMANRTIASGKVPKVVNRRLEDTNVIGRKLGTDDGVEVELTASVAVGLHTYGLDSSMTHPDSMVE